LDFPPSHFFLFEKIMSDNPYAAPTAFGQEVQSASSDSAPFFAVSLLKLTLLSLSTFGFYKLYWFYRNWKLIKERDNSDIMPFWRAFFGIIFCYQCFAKIKDAGTSRDIQPSLAAGPLATGWIILTLTWRLPDPYALITFGAVAFLLPVQAYVNRINAHDAPDHDPNARLSAWNWVAIVVGGFLFFLAIIGTIFPQLGDAS